MPALVALARALHRAARARRALGLPSAGLRDAVLPTVALAALGALVGLAAAQPAVRSQDRHVARADAAAYVVLDTSRSMLASRGPTGPTRLQRAKRVALELRRALDGFPVGVASVTDRVLPHLFPTADAESFARTVALAVRAGQPPAGGSGQTTSSLAALGAFARGNLFLPEARRRAVVVLTDAESSPFSVQALARELRSGPAFALEIVRMGGPDERVFAGGRPVAGYRPDPAAPAWAARVAGAASGHAFTENDWAGAARDLRDALRGGGPLRVTTLGAGRTPLAPWLLAAAALPLALLLGSRNVPWTGWRTRALATLDRARRRSSVG